MAPIGSEINCPCDRSKCPCVDPFEGFLSLCIKPMFVENSVVFCDIWFMVNLFS